MNDSDEEKGERKMGLHDEALECGALRDEVHVCREALGFLSI